jgi:RNA-binding protein
MSLANRTKRAFIAKAHDLHPIIIIGNQGLSKAIFEETDRALYDHELIKVRVNAEDKTERLKMVEELCQQLQCECLKVIGHIAILYRASDKKSKSSR